MRYTPEKIGTLVRKTRKAVGVTQESLALTSGTGLRFIIDLEKGKPTCQLGKGADRRLRAWHQNRPSSARSNRGEIGHGANA